MSEGVSLAEKGPMRLTMLPEIRKKSQLLNLRDCDSTYQLRQEYRTNRREVKFGKYRKDLSF